MTTIKVPEGFVLGAATSAYQLEGGWQDDGRGPSIWDTFTQTPNKVMGSIPGDRGADHYHRWREDLQLMKDLGLNSYRFSLSWSRLLPEGTGRVNQAGIDFYDHLIDGLLEAGIAPNVTLYHWDLPQALQDRGGWPNRDVVDWFGEYAALAFEKYGDRVPLWSTINEPIALWVGYGSSFFAPGTADPRAGKQAMHNAMLAHGRAVQEFRASDSTGEIGIVVDVWKRHPLTDSDADVQLALSEEDESFRFFYDELFAGGLSDRIARRLEEQGILPDIQDGDAALAAEPIDFLGVNVYSRIVVDSENFSPNWWESADQLPGGNYLSNGVELYPRALSDAVRVAREEYGVRVPVYITENGTAVNDVVTDDGVHDDERIAYLAQFLAEAVHAHDEGLDVRGYYLWSLMDNYEWAAAYTMRYGLIRVDPDTFDRSWKDSGLWYRDVLHNRSFELPDD